MNVSDFHPYFIDPFERDLESTPKPKIVNNLTYVLSKSSFIKSSLLSPLLNLSQSSMEIHFDFYDPIEIQPKRTFQENVIVNNLLLVNMLEISVHSIFIFIFIHLTIFLLLMFDLYIYAGVRMREWLHWKYDYT